MIVLFTDYGLHGPYIGQVEAVLSRESPKSTVINLFTDLPRQNARAAAYLLAAYASEFAKGSIFFCVVDPEVGSFNDNPVVMRLDNRWYIGPDNGVFDLLVRRSSNIECWKINWRPEKISSTFHGRDLYAPICAMIANGIDIPGEKIQWRDKHQWPDDLNEIIYIDDFGNCMTGLRAAEVKREALLKVANRNLNFASTYSTASETDPFWYENSNGLVEIAINKGSAAEALQLVIGSKVETK